MKNNLLIVFVTIIGFVLLNTNTTYIDYENLIESNEIEMSAMSCLNMMPGAVKYDEKLDKAKAYFIIFIKNMERDVFLNKYNINQIDLNGNVIKNNEFKYEEAPLEVDEPYGARILRFYSVYYNENIDNKIIVFLSEKATKKQYKVTFSCEPTETAW